MALSLCHISPGRIGGDPPRGRAPDLPQEVLRTDCGCSIPDNNRHYLDILGTGGGEQKAFSVIEPFERA